MQNQDFSLLRQFKKLSRKTLPNLSQNHGRWLKQKQYKSITKILSDCKPPQYYDSEETFNYLQSVCPAPGKYDYDSFNTWSRGVNRSLQLLRLLQLQELGCKILEVGCGDGMTGYCLSCYGHEVHLVDLEDWREKRAKGISFTQGDLCTELNLESESFDLVYSFNTFEHLRDPKAALAELIRVCRKNGLIYLEFDPLYASPWGLHTHRTINIPYPQFLFSPSFIEAKLQEIGIYDLGKERVELQFVNQWRLKEYQNLWESCGCEIVNLSFIKEFSYLDMVTRFPAAFRGLNLTLEDLTIKGIKVTLRK